MCYSALVKADHQAFQRLYNSKMSLEAFHDMYWRRHSKQPLLKVPKAIDDLFLHPGNEQERAIKALIDEFNAGQASRYEQELFAQKTRLVEAERKLASKPTKAAAESQRIATDKISAALGKLADLKRTEPKERDRRIFPSNYAPVMVWENGERVIKPMRYLCRPAGKPAFYDTKYPGIYNARRDNLEGFWKGQFGHSHGVLIANAFYENVKRHKAEGRELAEGEEPQNVVLEFKPRPLQDMLAACLWSRWTGPDGEELLSFAAITDEPPEEVAAAGHDRCIIPIRHAQVDAWLKPEGQPLPDLYAILDDRERPYYEHRMAA